MDGASRCQVGTCRRKRRTQASSRQNPEFYLVPRDLSTNLFSFFPPAVVRIHPVAGDPLATFSERRPDCSGVIFDFVMGCGQECCALGDPRTIPSWQIQRMKTPPTMEKNLIMINLLTWRPQRHAFTEPAVLPQWPSHPLLAERLCHRDR